MSSENLTSDGVSLTAVGPFQTSVTGTSFPGADFRLIAESIPHIIWMANPDGTTEFLNSQAVDYTGLPPEADLEWDWHSLVHPEDAERARRGWGYAVKNGISFEQDFRIRRADGIYRWHAFRARPAHGKDGEVVKWIGTATDIEHQVITQECLRQAERDSAESLTLLETLQSTAPVGFGFVDLDFRVRRLNETMAMFNEMSIEDHLGKTLAEVIPTVWPHIEPWYRQVLETGEPVLNCESTAEIPRGSGKVLSWLAHYYPVRINDEMIGIGTVLVDITERKKAEGFRTALMDNMAEGMCAVDRDGRLMYMNAAASKLLGWSEEDLRGKQMHDIVHFQHADGSPYPADDCVLLKMIKEAKSDRITDDAFTRRDGSIFPVSYSAAPLMCGDSAYGVVVVFRDVTEEADERARVQRELDALTWVGRIRDALDDGKFMLHSQPIVPLSGGVAGEEVLLRMIGSNGHLIPPGSFLPTAEKYGLIGEIDQWVIRNALCRAVGGRRVQINLSADSIGHLDLLPIIERELSNSGVDPADVIFEITETALMGDIEAGEAFARGLTRIGCGLALDDFGTGFGSLTYLKNLPFDYLKIDMEFVRDLRSSTASQHLVKAIVNLSQGFGLQTIAEGVEDEETLELLRSYGVDHAQGFHLGRPSAFGI